ncbi:unnamed protein product [Clonostachys rosea]|uniref:AA1-like domain-containing protein n=1 Tax=Bionectria ochroleuca TaxID=29856 RepID=A0ABY6UWA0_BIOOC|nr:unnamed protein product [Clonostachys rosea]
MRFITASLALLAGFASTQAQEIAIRNFWITAKGEIENGEFKALFSEFHIEEGNLICNTRTDDGYPTGRTNGCFVSLPGEEIEHRDWDFAIDGVTADNHIASLTLWNKEESPERTGSGSVVLHCQRNGRPGDGLNWIMCQQTEPANITLK